MGIGALSGRNVAILIFLIIGEGICTIHVCLMSDIDDSPPPL